MLRLGVLMGAVAGSKEAVKRELERGANYVAFKGADNKDAECYNEEYEVIPRKQQPEHDFVSGGERLNVFSAVELQLKVNTLKDNNNNNNNNNTVIVTAKKGKEVLGEAKADSSGKFTAKINKVQSAGSLLHVTESDATGTAKTSLKTIVKKGTPPSAPKVNAVSNKSTVVAGKTGAGLQVTVKNESKKVIASGTATSKGDFKIKIKKQKAAMTPYFNGVG